MGRIAAAHPEGLIIPARPRLGAAQLLLTPTQATIMMRSRECAALRYERVLDGEQLQSGNQQGWCIAPWGVSGAGAVGLAVGAFGEEARALSATRPRIVPRLDRLRWGVAPGEAGVPLLRHHMSRPDSNANVDTVRALLVVLRDVPRWRDRLADSQRMRVLADALQRRRLRRPSERTGAVRVGVEVAMAWQTTGIVHRYGRPIPGDPVVGPDAALEAAHRALARNRHARHDERADERLAQHVHAVYLDVEPWPFEALTT